MLRKIAALSMLALCSLASGCWFNSPCCSPYDRAGPTFGGDPSIPNDFNYRKGSILGSDTSAGGEYINDDGVEYVPGNGTVSEYEAEQQPMQQSAPQSMQQTRRYPGPSRAAYPMNQGAAYQGMGYQGRGYQGSGYQSNDNQGPGSYRRDSNPRYQSQQDSEIPDQEEGE